MIIMSLNRIGCVVLVFLLCSVFTTVNSLNLVCYFSSWAVYRNFSGIFDISNIDPHLCTHVNFAFVELYADGELYIVDPWESNDIDEGGHYEGFKHLEELKKQNSDLKILLSLGGWNEGSKNFSIVSTDPVKRRRLRNGAIALIEKYNFDGLDVDWEYPTLRDGAYPKDKENFVTLLKDFKALLEPRGKLLTAAVAGAVDKIQAAYDPEILNYLDLVNIMSYDYHGAFDNYIGHISPLHAAQVDYAHGRNSTYVASTALEYWIYLGADPQKLTMGIPTYGRTFTLENPGKRSLYDPILGPGTPGVYSGLKGTLGYNEICAFCLTIPHDAYWDSEQLVPHIVYDTDQWVGYDNETSIEEKVKFALSQNIGGFMVWTLDQDDFLGDCGGGKYPLVNKIKSAALEYLKKN